MTCSDPPGSAAYQPKLLSVLQVVVPAQHMVDELISTVPADVFCVKICAVRLDDVSVYGEDRPVLVLNPLLLLFRLAY